MEYKMKKITIIALIALMGIMSSYKVSEAQFFGVVLSLTGYIVDSDTKEPIAMRVEAFDSKGNRIYYGRTKSENDGYYFITGLKPGAKYTVKLSDNERYADKEETISMPDVDNYEEIKKDFLVEDNKETAQPGK
jgi:hypothetical protein